MSSQQFINTGSGVNAGDSDSLRGGLIKTENNFNDIYASSSHLSYFPITGSIGQIKWDTGGSEVLGITGSVSCTQNFTAGTGFSIPMNDSSIPVTEGRIVGPGQFNDEVYVDSSLALSGNIPRMTIRGESCKIQLENNFGARRTLLNGSFSNQKVFFYGSTNNKLLNTQNGELGIKTTANAGPALVKMQVLGDVSASDYSAAAMPNVDPVELNKFFRTGSGRAVGVQTNLQVLCLSQGV